MSLLRLEGIMGLSDRLRGYINNCFDKFDAFMNRADSYTHTVRSILDYGALSLDAALYESPGLVGAFNRCARDGREILHRFYDAGERLLGKTPEPDTYSVGYDVASLSRIISLKNKHFWKNNAQLEDLLAKEAGIVWKNDRTIASVIRDAMRLKVEDKRYVHLPVINYDSSIAPSQMKEDIVNRYIYSEKTLNELSADLEKKYGMHISVSTISRNARKTLGNSGMYFQNRRKAKEYYQNKY